MKSNHDHWLFNISISQISLEGMINKYEIKCQIVNMKTFKTCHLNVAHLLINNISYLQMIFCLCLQHEALLLKEVSLQNM